MTLSILVFVHVLVCSEKARESIGKVIERNIWNSKYIKSIIGEMESSSNYEKHFYFIVERVVFPVILVSVFVVTGFDIYLYKKYCDKSKTASADNEFLYLFPIPCVVPSVFVVNFLMSVGTAIKISYWEKVKKCYDKLMSGWNDRGCYHNLKSIWNELNEHCPKLCKNKDRAENETEPLKKTSGDKNYNSISKSDNNMKNDECKQESKKILNENDECSKRCQNILRFLTLVLLFGIVYLFYHGFWLIIALLVYPGRILLGGIFIVPGILLIIPIWNTLIKGVTNCYGTSNCCNSCCTFICNCCLYIFHCCICCCLCLTFSLIRCCIRCWLCLKNLCFRCCCKGHKKNSKEGKQESNNKSRQKSCVKGCLWIMLFVYELIFCGLFIAILVYISKFLLTSIKVQEKTIQLVLSYIVIAAVSGIMAWLSTDLTIDRQDNEKNKDLKGKDEEQSGKHNIEKDKGQGEQPHNGEGEISAEVNPLAEDTQ